MASHSSSEQVLFKFVTNLPKLGQSINSLNLIDSDIVVMWINYSMEFRFSIPFTFCQFSINLSSFLWWGSLTSF